MAHTYRRAFRGFRQLTLLAAGFLLCSTVFTSAGCHKDTDCRVTIKCVDTVGNALNGANVFLYATVGTSTADVKASGTTDKGGEAHFTFQLPAVFDVLATYTAKTATLQGKGVVTLAEGENVTKEITLRKE